MRIKVCGMTRVNEVQQLQEMGVEFAGFIFYPNSPRYVYNSVSNKEIKGINKTINKVGVFVNAEPDELLRTVDACGLSLVQLHGDESPETCRKIAAYVSVIKAFRLNDNNNIEVKIREYNDAVDMFMFDTESAVYGGTGKKFNWQILKDANILKPFFLSGGIQPQDVENLKIFQHEDVSKNLFAIDINSRFEVAPGLKDIERIRTFVAALK